MSKPRGRETDAEISKLLEQALGRYSAGDLDGALDLYTQILIHDSENPDALVALDRLWKEKQVGPAPHPDAPAAAEAPEEETAEPTEEEVAEFDASGLFGGDADSEDDAEPEAPSPPIDPKTAADWQATQRSPGDEGPARTTVVDDLEQAVQEHDPFHAETTRETAAATEARTSINELIAEEVASGEPAVITEELAEDDEAVESLGSATILDIPALSEEALSGASAGDQAGGETGSAAATGTDTGAGTPPEETAADPKTILEIQRPVELTTEPEGDDARGDRTLLEIRAPDALAADTDDGSSQNGTTQLGMTAPEPSAFDAAPEDPTTAVTDHQIPVQATGGQPQPAAPEPPTEPAPAEGGEEIELAGTATDLEAQVPEQVSVAATDMQLPKLGPRPVPEPSGDTPPASPAASAPPPEANLEQEVPEINTTGPVAAPGSGPTPAPRPPAVNLDIPIQDTRGFPEPAPGVSAPTSTPAAPTATPATPAPTPAAQTPAPAAKTLIAYGPESTPVAPAPAAPRAISPSVTPSKLQKVLAWLREDPAAAEPGARPPAASPPGQAGAATPTVTGPGGARIGISPATASAAPPQPAPAAPATPSSAPPGPEIQPAKAGSPRAALDASSAARGEIAGAPEPQPWDEALEIPAVAPDFTWEYVLAVLRAQNLITDGLFNITREKLLARAENFDASRSPIEILALERLISPNSRRKTPLDEARITRALAEQTNMEYQEILDTGIDVEGARRVFSKDLARKYTAIPTRVDAESLVIATDNPWNTELLGIVQASTTRRIQLVLTPKRQILELIGAVYTGRSRQQGPAEIFTDTPETKDAGLTSDRVQFLVFLALMSAAIAIVAFNWETIEPVVDRGLNTVRAALGWEIPAAAVAPRSPAVTAGEDAAGESSLGRELRKPIDFAEKNVKAYNEKIQEEHRVLEQIMEEMDR